MKQRETKGSRKVKPRKEGNREREGARREKGEHNIGEKGVYLYISV